MTTPQPATILPRKYHSNVSCLSTSKTTAVGLSAESSDPADSSSAPSPPAAAFTSLDRAISSRATTVDVVGVDTWRRFSRELAKSALFATVEVNVFEVKRVDVARDVAEDGEADVD